MLPLVGLDVDGTLVGTSGVATEVVWAAAHAAVERGQHLALATARGAFGSAWEMARRLDPDGWHVFHAGAAIVHTGTGAVRGHDLPDAEVRSARQLADANGWVLEYYSATDYVVDDDSPPAVDHAALLGVPHVRRAPDELAGAVVRVQFVVPEADAPIIAASVSPTVTTSSATSPIMPGFAFVTMTVGSVDKGQGMTAIAGELGVDLADVMVVGDGPNDLPAFDVVGHPVAMGNAAEDVKARARHVVASVDDDGVAEALMLSAELATK